MNLLKSQYDLIKYTREQLFSLCEQLDHDDYVKEIEGFGWGSVRNLHAHVAECYQSWLGKFGLKKNITPVNPENVRNVNDMREVFNEIDTLVCSFIDEYEGEYEYKLTGRVPWQEDHEELSVLWLFTHTTTHEFHHKGQIVSMARQLGYIPSDTDLLTPTDMKNLLNRHKCMN
ncbi:DinB family protein [Virgibacillus salinus]|uniref:Uncharacterized damage-inducible protein DinB (Forms a four-helix bundle) n=1 Tax=Virgibacillus salinus TaxID=553311 RepID=A0A1H0Y6Z2_9BACI|nr:DinB family protein [Virgibacillus salinus]SDQ10833.1 Uncharacterized damage-inducible protein DinB (forms a four-helix bundle) [Virgibacillus salinus]